MQPHQSAVRLYAGRAHRPAFIGGLHCQRARALQQGFHVKGTGFHAGENLDFFDMGLRQELQPHRLPDAGGAGVVAAVGVKQLALLAPGDQGIPLVILGVDGQDVFALAHGFGHVKAEGNVSAGVGSHADAVNEGLAAIVHRAEVQRNPAGKLLLRQVNGAAIPHAVQKILVVHAGKLALGAEGHQNDIGKLRVRLIQARGPFRCGHCRSQRPTGRSDSSSCRAGIEAWDVRCGESCSYSFLLWKGPKAHVFLVFSYYKRPMLERQVPLFVLFDYRISASGRLRIPSRFRR